MVTSRVHRRPPWRPVTLGALALIPVLALAAEASPVFGPKEYVQGSGLPLPVIERFPACRPEEGGQLRVENGPGGRPQASLAVVVLNRRDTILMVEGAGQPRVRERAVPLAADNALLVWMIGPRGATLAVTVTGAGACLEVAITSPPPGASVPEGLVQVRGTVEGPPDVGIAVNGVPAAVHGGQFVAVLHLTPGPTELTATATTSDGTTAVASQPLVVVEAPEAPVRLVPSPAGGPAPLTVGFLLSTLAAVADVKLDLDGDGSVEFQGPSVEGQEFTFDQPGVYVVTAQVTDIGGQVHSASSVVAVYDRAALDTRLQAVWSGFKAALRAGDVARAVSFLHSESRDSFEDQLRLLRPQTLAAIDAYLTGIQLVEIGPGGAEYEMLRDRDGVTLSFAVWFRVDHDGIWRLFNF
jgi:hypothetical protein